MRRCGDCGKPLKGRSNKRYCNSTCRSKAATKRARGGGPPAVVPGPVEVSTREQVNDEQPLGAAAIVLARRIDQARDSGESGSSVASMVRELRATLIEANPSTEQRDVVDELRERREERLRGRAS